MHCCNDLKLIIIMISMTFIIKIMAGNIIESVYFCSPIQTRLIGYVSFPLVTGDPCVQHLPFIFSNGTRSSPVVEVQNLMLLHHLATTILRFDMICINNQ